MTRQLVVGLARVLVHSSPQSLIVNGRPRRVWLLFAGNCQYTPAGFVPTYRPSLDDGLLDLRLVSGDQPFARLRLLLAVATGTLGTCGVYEARVATVCRLSSADGTLSLSIDGETAHTSPAVTLRKRRDALVVYRPQG